jgi:hypothetical protein
LHEEIACAGTAIDTQARDFFAGVLAHGFHEVGDLKSDAVERGSGTLGSTSRRSST